MIQAPPKGLRMISGNAKATNDTTASNHEFTCYTDANGAVFHGWQKSIPNCTIPGEELFMHVYFPDCWDGINLDSPDHKSHMANKNKALANNLANGCPATHPVLIPTITFGLKWKVQPGQTKTWRLASDNYDKTLPGGYSGHGDWINGWDEVIMSGIVKNCLNKDLDAAGGLLCDGRMFAYGT